MSDFSFHTDVSRDHVADALCENEEQAVFVLGRVGSEMSISDIVNYVHSIEHGSDTAKIADFYRKFSDLIEAV